MRLHSITLEGFRGFVGRAKISLDADVVLFHGPNGVGKTSLLDGILWGLSGRLDRLGETGSPVSLYAKEGIARVELVLQFDDKLISLTRVTDGSDEQLRLADGADVLEGPQAKARLISLILPHVGARGNAGDAVARVLTRGVYLQQDLIREFIDSDSAADRFALVSEIIGAGVVLDLQNELERSRAAWSRSTTSTRRERLEPQETQLSRVAEALSRLESTPSSTDMNVRTEADAIFKEAGNLLGAANLPASSAPTNASELDRFLKAIAAARSGLEREFVLITALTDELKTRELLPPDDLESEVTELERRKAELDAFAKDVQAQTAAELGRLEQERQRQISDAERSRRLAAMAQIALDELGDTCPVCTQPYNRHTAEAHLRALIGHAGSRDEGGFDNTVLNDLQQRATEVSARLTDIRSKIADQKQALAEAQARSSILKARLGDQGIESIETAASALAEKESRVRHQIDRTSEIITRGERLGLAIVRLGEERQRAELSGQRADLQERIALLRAEIEEQERTHALAGRIIEGLRAASIEATARQVQSLRPLLQRIYSRIDPHPTFKLTQVITEMQRGKGLLHAGVSDPELDGKLYQAGPILSSSQLNSFAVSLFLALNLGIRSLRLDLAILDDPLQSLDAINLLGLVDVLRRLRQRRQIFVSTHDDQLLGLLQRKLRPAVEGERLIVVRFDRWSRDGPSFREATFEYDAEANPRVLLAA